MTDNIVIFPDRKGEERAARRLPSRAEYLRGAIDHAERAAVGATLALHVAPGDPLQEAVELLARARNIMVSANPAWQPGAEQARVAETRRADVPAVVDQSRAPDPPTPTGQGPSGSTGDAA